MVVLSSVIEMQYHVHKVFATERSAWIFDLLRFTSVLIVILSVWVHRRRHHLKDYPDACFEFNHGIACVYIKSFESKCILYIYIIHCLC